MSLPKNLALAVVMQRTRLDNRWQSEKWEPVGVLPDTDAPVSAPRLLKEDERCAQWLHPGFQLELFRDEAEGYYLNISAKQAVVFVNWLEEEGVGVPQSVTVSYNEAARQMDGGARVEGVPLPAEWRPWLEAFVKEHYKPEPKRRSRPPSFKGARRDLQ